MLRKKWVQALRVLPIAAGVSLLAAPMQSFAATPLFQNAVSVHNGILFFDAFNGDVNGDGKMDLIVADIGASQITVLLGNGDGTFRPGLNTAVGSNPRDIAIGDFDGDGKVDLAVANTRAATVSILIGQGNGTFEADDSPESVGIEPYGIVAADLNGDGHDDVAVSNNGSNSLSILLGNGDGTFGSAISIPVGINPRSLVASDFNGDGKADLAVANTTSNTVTVLLGDGSGTHYNPTNYFTGSSPIGLHAVDLDLDGKMDLALAANMSDAMNVLIGDGNGTFSAPVVYSAGAGSYPLDLTVGDFDGDGNPDLVGGSQIGDLTLLLGNGNGTFQAAMNFPSYGRFLTSGDYNGDGKSDLVMINDRGVYVMNSAAEGALSFQSALYGADENEGSVIVAVYRTGGTYGQAKVRIQTADGTATAGTDYAAVNDTIVFNQGETSKTYSIPIMNNAGYQGDRTFSVHLSSPANGAILGTTVTAAVTIREVDPVSDTTAPVVDASKFSAIDHYSGTPDQLFGAAGAVGEPGAIVRAFRWTDSDSDGVVDAGELGSAISLGTSAADGSIAAANIGDLAPGTYAFVIAAEDAASNESARSAATAVNVTLAKGAAPDTTAPAWPGGAGVVFSGVSTSGVSLGWPEASDNVGIQAYEIYKAGLLVTSVPATSRSYAITGLSAGTAYAFSIKAVDGAGNKSSELAGTVTTTASSTSSGSGSGSSAPSYSSEKRLKELSLSIGGKPLALTPSFRPEVNDYSATTTEEQIALSFGAMHTAARVEINGQSVTGSYTKSLDKGDNLFNILIRAEDGTTLSYRLTVKRESSGDETGPGTEVKSSFNDIKGHWAEADIQAAFALGIVKGDQAGAFRPNAAINRAEFIVMLNRVRKGSSDSSNVFSDGPAISAWARDAVNAAAAQGIITGYGDGTFRPDQSVTRAEMAAMLVRAMKWQTESGSAATAFADDAGIPAWAKRYVLAAAKNGILQGQGDNRFAPNESLTRAEAAALLVRLSKISST
ncbi:FG-GAP-like repeat-containing protein [Cohnella cholangitidis]|uniref:Uncharacterized protein n=1 Tax=Cohnella cholangitidis TaxID=2598458 RepID=A0A7G5C0G0_9BACL|nr:FG-GAP-like repeat-containing protein [Cohnella cholangitidis]QMV42694.1 hypothetical protein FPL14_16975 [Cohnella cholangitidis]